MENYRVPLEKKKQKKHISYANMADKIASYKMFNKNRRIQKKKKKEKRNQGVQSIESCYKHDKY